MRISAAIMWATRTEIESCNALACGYVILTLSTPRGPVAQLGARFHGMEEVVSSNLTRSTKCLKYRLLAAVQTNQV